MKKSIFIAIALLTCSLSSFSQDNKKPKETETDKPAKTPLEQLNAFYDNINAYYKTNNPDLSPVSKLLTADFQYTRNTEDVKNNVKTVRLTGEGMMRDLKSIKDLNMRVERKVVKVIFDQTSNILANVSVLLELKYFQDSLLVGNVRAFASHTFVKEGFTWKIKDILTDRVADHQLVGACPCKITKSLVEKDDEYLVKVMYPNGGSYETDEYKVSFKGEGNTKFIIVGSNYYTWKDMQINAVKTINSNTSESVGKAGNNTEAIKVILEKNLYKSQCAYFEPLK